MKKTLLSLCDCASEQCMCAYIFVEAIAQKHNDGGTARQQGFVELSVALQCDAIYANAKFK